MEISIDAISLLNQDKVTINLSGLPDISSEIASALSSLPANIFLDGIQCLSPEAATCFSRHTRNLRLDGIRSISVEVAEAIASQKGGLWLGGLETISADVARALANHCGNLYLHGVTSIQQNAANELAKLRGVLSLKKLEIRSGEIPPLENRKSGTINMKVDGVLLSDKWRRPGASSADYAFWELEMLADRHLGYGYGDHLVDDYDGYDDEDNRAQIYREHAEDSDSYSRSSEEGWYYED